MNSSIDITACARGSPLSRAQMDEVLKELRVFHPRVVFHPTWVVTTGDKDQKTSLRTLEKTDFFTKEIDELQLAGGCRISIHSAKDLPDPLPRGLAMVALTQGVDPSDALVLRENETLESLPRGARIGTSSARREKNIRDLRRDLICVDVRGNIEARLALLDQRVVDGLVMAEAALIRLGLTHRNRVPLPGERAPLQGQLAVLALSDDKEMKELFKCIDVRARMKTILYLGTDPVHYESQGRSPGHLIHYPVIKVVPRPLDHPELQKAYRDLDQYTHILFTSKNAVQIFFSHLEALGKTLAQKTIVAIGEVTAEHLRRKNVSPQFVSRIESQEGLVQLIRCMVLKDPYFFLPRSSLARPVLAEFFQESKIRYAACDLYDTEIQEIEPKPDLDLVDEIVFTSPSTVKAFLAIFGNLPKNKTLTPIGPVTRQVLHEFAGQ